MTEMFVMRRANGDLFTEQIDGKLGIPVWSNAEGPARYKERNPRLMTCLPARLTRSLVNRIGSGLGSKGAVGFFLLPEDDPDADLVDGIAISLEEILPGLDAP